MVWGAFSDERRAAVRTALLDARHAGLMVLSVAASRTQARPTYPKTAPFSAGATAPSATATLTHDAASTRTLRARLARSTTATCLSTLHVTLPSEGPALVAACQQSA